MAKTPKVKSSKTATSKPKTKAKPSKADNAKRLAAEQQAFYEAHRQRIDDAIAKCLKHFNKDEPEIVRAVARMLFDAYVSKRANLDLPNSRPLFG